MEKKQNELARAFKLWRCSVPHRIIYVSLIPLVMMTFADFLYKGKIFWSCCVIGCTFAAIFSSYYIIFFPKLCASSARKTRYSLSLYPFLYRVLLLLGNILAIITRIPWLTRGTLQHKEFAGYMVCLAMFDIICGLIVDMAYKSFIYYIFVLMISIALAIMANRNFGNVLVEQLGIGYNLSVILPIISCFISYIILRLLSYVARKLPVEEEMIRHYTMK
ncbi:MAG: hypothetical protein SPL99_01990 [Catonella sp.]|nr:hypothetical protein [Catonella sp.]MDY6356847.1 hypothetical protein [Catonella sp.]